MIIYKVLRRFVPLAFLATALCGLVYLAVQQSLRQGANDPQIQMAEDYAAEFRDSVANGTPMNILIPFGNNGVDIANSLSPYYALFDENGNGAGGNGYLIKNSSLSLPRGVFSNPELISQGEIRFTWEPRPGVRQAVVLAKTPLGFVMAGRSLREVEIRENRAFVEAAAVWLASVGGLLLLEILFAVIESRWIKKRLKRG
jgi:hypothetical protein